MKQGVGLLSGQTAGPNVQRFDKEDQARQLEIRQQQGQYAELLRAQAQGRGPSLFAPALAAAQRAGTATAASARGANVALAGRTAAQQTARMGMGAAELRSKEQLMAQQQYAQLLQAQRQADLQARNMGVQLSAAQLQSDSAASEGSANRGQIFGAALTSAGATLGSDPALKNGVRPAYDSYQQPYSGYGQPNPYAQALTLGNPGSAVDMKDDVQPAGVSVEPMGGVHPSFRPAPARTTALAAPKGNSRFVDALAAFGETLGQQRFQTPPLPGTAGAGFGASQLQDRGPQPENPLPAGAVPLKQQGWERQEPSSQQQATMAAVEAWLREQQAARARQDHSQYVDPTSIDLALAQGRSGIQQQPRPASTDSKAASASKVSAALSAFSRVMATGSDPDMKANLRFQQPGDIAATAAQAQPITFSYKPEFAPAEGTTTQRRLGMSASKTPGSLADNPIYAPAVVRGPDGYDRVNGGQALMANIAVTTDMAKKQQADAARLDALEAALVAQASGKGARGKRVKAADVLRDEDAVAAAPPAGARPSGLRYAPSESPRGAQSAVYEEGAASLQPSEPESREMPRLRGAIHETSRATARDLALGKPGYEALQRAYGRGDVDVGLIDKAVMRKQRLDRLKAAAEAGDPRAVLAYDEALRSGPTVFPDSRTARQYEVEAAKTRGMLNEGQMGGLAFKLQQSKPTALGGFMTPGAVQNEQTRARAIQAFTDYASDAAERDAAAREGASIRLRPQDVEALLKARGVKLRKGEVQKALEVTARNQPIFDL